MGIRTLLTVLLLFSVCFCQSLIFLSPSDFAETFRNNTIKVISSPIGFKPKTGTLHGVITLAEPLSACTDIEEVGQMDDQQDVFIMADDLGCLESVKAQNLAISGAYIGIIKRNINNTFHDREVNVVHIPILEIEADDFDRIKSYITKNPGKGITAVADFNSYSPIKKINMQMWLSPTQQKAYEYILDLQHFISNQPDKIAFFPRFVLHSQSNKKQYIGCYSSGRFCPPELEYEGRPEGTRIVAESLRQIVIASKSLNNWFNYASFYYDNCLNKVGPALWQTNSIEICSQNAMESSSISSKQIEDQINKSFQGNRPEVDSNIYLEQQRQLYLEEKITKFPILLINGKQYLLQDTMEIKLRICTMIHPDPKEQTTQCQKLTNPPLFSTGQIFIILGFLIVLLAVIMVICKYIMYKRIKKQMKGEVDKTLQQYYKYMDTFDEPDLPGTGKVPLMDPKVEGTQIGSVQLTQIKDKK